MREEPKSRTNWVPIAISLLALATSAYFGNQQRHLQRSLAHVDLDPVLQTFFRVPEKENPFVVVHNNGPIPAVSLAVKNKVLVYDPGFRIITQFSHAEVPLSGMLAFKDILKPMDNVKASLYDVGAKNDVVAVYIFEIKYYRDTDMKEYEQHSLFFVDHGMVYTHKEYSNRPLYSALMTALAIFKEPGLTIGQGEVSNSMKALEKENK